MSLKLSTDRECSWEKVSVTARSHANAEQLSPVREPPAVAAAAAAPVAPASQLQSPAKASKPAKERKSARQQQQTAPPAPPALGGAGFEEPNSSRKFFNALSKPKVRLDDSSYLQRAFHTRI